MTRPHAFVGSSGVGAPIAQALAMALGDRALAQVWTKGTFRPSRTTIEDLEKLAKSGIDCALMVFTPDDPRDRGRGPLRTMRDNVLFEFGLFMGALGRGRTFGIKCSHCEVDVPTDLLGVTWLTFDQPHDLLGHTSDDSAKLASLAHSLGRVADDIISILRELPAEPVRILGDDSMVRAYPTRGHVGRGVWNGIISDVFNHIWLHGMSELGYADDDSVPGILRAAAVRHCQIRILLLDPESPSSGQIDVDEGAPAGTLAARTRLSIHRFYRMRSDGIPLELRLSNVVPGASLVRGDDRMLVTPYLRFLTGNNAPTFDLHAASANDIFAKYVRYFETMWTQAHGAEHS